MCLNFLFNEHGMATKVGGGGVKKNLIDARFQFNTIFETYFHLIILNSFKKSTFSKMVCSIKRGLTLFYNEYC